MYCYVAEDQLKLDYAIPALHTERSSPHSFELNRQPLCRVCSNGCKSKWCAKVSELSLQEWGGGEINHVKPAP